MKILWLCGLPKSIQRGSIKWKKLWGRCYMVLGCWSSASNKKVDLHIACPVTKGPWKNQSFHYKGATFHLIRVILAVDKQLTFLIHFI